jgi:hypothetical protein
MNRAQMRKGKVVRLAITWSKATDTALRSYLGAKASKDGALAEFIEDAVKWRLFDEVLADTRQSFSDLTTDELVAMIDEAVAHTRKK